MERPETAETRELAGMAAREELVAQATMEAMAPHSIPMARTAALAELVARLEMVATAGSVEPPVEWRQWLGPTAMVATAVLEDLEALAEPEGPERMAPMERLRVTLAATEAMAATEPTAVRAE
jgi:hypothetical protein